MSIPNLSNNTHIFSFVLVLSIRATDIGNLLDFLKKKAIKGWSMQMKSIISVQIANKGIPGPS